MNKTLRAVLFWAPRIGAILFILFVSLFALDIFGQGYSFWETVVGLTVHLLPSIVLAVALVMAWRREWIGALWYIGWAVFYVGRTRGAPISVYLLIAGIPFVIGVLFWIGWVRRTEIRGA
jgi:hypothetical protein